MKRLRKKCFVREKSRDSATDGGQTSPPPGKADAARQPITPQAPTPGTKVEVTSTSHNGPIPEPDVLLQKTSETPRLPLQKSSSHLQSAKHLLSRSTPQTDPTTLSCRTALRKRPTYTGPRHAARDCSMSIPVAERPDVAATRRRVCAEVGLTPLEDDRIRTHANDLLALTRTEWEHGRVVRNGQATSLVQKQSAFAYRDGMGDGVAMTGTGKAQSMDIKRKRQRIVLDLEGAQLFSHSGKGKESDGSSVENLPNASLSTMSRNSSVKTWCTSTLDSIADSEASLTTATTAPTTPSSLRWSEEC